jgi:hypothetical protein
VAGVALDREMARLSALPVFAGGPLAAGRPRLAVRRARRRPNRLGFAVPTQFRLSVTAYPGIGTGDVLETLLHELVHLHVGRAVEAHAWHGRTFKSALAAAMSQAYGVDCPPPSNTRHGTYAGAIDGRWDGYPGPWMTAASKRDRLAVAASKARAAEASGDDALAGEEWRRYRLIRDANRDPDELLAEGIAMSMRAIELAKEMRQ